MNPKLRDALVGGLVAIFLSPITIFIGYQLNDYLARDRVSIVHLKLIPTLNRMPNPGKPLRFLTRDSMGMGMVFREYLEEDSGLNRRERDLFYKEEGFTKEERVILLSTLEGFVNHTTQVEKDLELVRERLEKSNEDIDIKKIIKGTFLEEKCLPMNYFDESIKENYIKSYANRKDLNLQAMQYAKRTIEYVKRYKYERTGDLRITVGLLNAGNTDGLIMSEGELLLADMNIPIIGEIKKAEKRSVVYAWFYINKAKAQQSNIGKLNDILKNQEGISAVVKLEDFRGNTIQSSAAELPRSD